jgi:hypothetical protein
VAKKIRFGNTWLVGSRSRNYAKTQGYAGRFGLSFLQPTRVKAKLVLERLPAIRKYHMYTARKMGLPTSAEEKKAFPDPLYGKYPGKRRLWIDAVPLDFRRRGKLAAPIGTRVLHSREPKREVSMRVATMMVCNRASRTEPQPPAALILKGMPSHGPKKVLLVFLSLFPLSLCRTC